MKHEQTIESNTPQQSAKEGLRFKKDGTPYKSNFSKQVRKVIENNNKERVRSSIENFANVLQGPKTTLQELIGAMQISKTTIYSTIDAGKIKLNKDGSINKKTLKKDFRLKYNELEETKRTEYEKIWKDKVAAPRDYTLEELLVLEEKLSKAKKPFSGKFKKESQAQ